MKKPLISININTGSYQYFISSLLAITSKASSYVCVANVHMLVEAHKDPAFAKIVNNADMVTPDGMPLCIGLQLMHGTQQDRVCGMDLLPDLLTEASDKRIPVYFYGGTDEMLDKTKGYLLQNHPSLIVAGMHSPPFLPLAVSGYEREQEAKRINASGARLIFVILGCPKQEKWMAAMKGKVNGCMIGIGGALPVLIGLQKRAPDWMQKYSLEWLYRLIQEPKRLFKRYFITNSTFLWLLLKAWVSKKIGRNSSKDINQAIL